MRRDRSTFLLRGLLGLSLGALLAACGCGGANSAGEGAANDGDGGRYNAMQKLGKMQTKADLAAKKKQGLAELASKKDVLPER